MFGFWRRSKHLHCIAEHSALVVANGAPSAMTDLKSGMDCNAPSGKEWGGSEELLCKPSTTPGYALVVPGVQLDGDKERVLGAPDNVKQFQAYCN